MEVDAPNGGVSSWWAQSGSLNDQLPAQIAREGSESTALTPRASI